MDIKKQKRIMRHKKIRAKVTGTASMPRLSVFRSNKYIYAQIIDDSKGVTLAVVSDKSVKGKSKTEKAKEVGAALAKVISKKNINKVVFDRGGFIYTGRIKALAEAAREGGLKF
jgi:large subunit ribosomal protein L18